MKRMILFFVLTVAAAVFFAACSTPEKTTNTNTNTNANAAKSTGPSKDALVTLDKKAWEAWKNHDGKFFEGFLADNFVGFDEKGQRSDKAAAVKWLSENKCEVKSYSLSDEQMTPAGADVAALTYKAATDVTCDGKAQPAELWVASIFVRSGSEWKGVYHNEIPVAKPKTEKADKVDKAEKGDKTEKSDMPAAPEKAEKSDKSEKAAPPSPAKASDKPAAETKPADATSDALVAAVKKGWEAWKNRDAKGLADAITNDFVLIAPSGERFDRAGALKVWTEPKCDIKSISVTDQQGLSLAKDAGLVTLKGSAEGMCDGAPLGALWGTYLMVKEGENWKAALIFETPAS